MLQAVQNYEPFKLDLSSEIIRENLYALFALSNNSSNCNKSQILFLACGIWCHPHSKYAQKFPKLDLPPPPLPLAGTPLRVRTFYIFTLPS